MTAHIEITEAVVRTYSSEEASFENKDDYDGICTIRIIEDTAFISGLHGSLSVTESQEIRGWLTELNIRKVKFTHKKKSSTINLQK